MGRALEAVGGLTAYIWRMCGRFTRNYTWQQIQALYRLTVPAAIPNLRPDYNVCPTDPVDVVVPNDGARAGIQPRHKKRTRRLMRRRGVCSLRGDEDGLIPVKIPRTPVGSSVASSFFIGHSQPS